VFAYIYRERERSILCVKISERWSEWCRGYWLRLCDRHKHLAVIDLSSNSHGPVFQLISKNLVVIETLFVGTGTDPVQTKDMWIGKF
jgi:hypothetical protein